MNLYEILIYLRDHGPAQMQDIAINLLVAPDVVEGAIRQLLEGGDVAVLRCKGVEDQVYRITRKGRKKTSTFSDR